MNAFVSVVGMDQKGIIQQVSTVLYQQEVNILNINQSIVDGYFTMVMQVDLADMGIELKALQSSLNTVGKSMDLKIKVQHQELFTAMHTI